MTGFPHLADYNDWANAFSRWSNPQREPTFIHAWVDALWRENPGATHKEHLFEWADRKRAQYPDFGGRNSRARIDSHKLLKSFVGSPYEIQLEPEADQQDLDDLVDYLSKSSDGRFLLAETSLDTKPDLALKSYGNHWLLLSDTKEAVYVKTNFNSIIGKLTDNTRTNS